MHVTKIFGDIDGTQTHDLEIQSLTLYQGWVESGKVESESSPSPADFQNAESESKSESGEVESESKSESGFEKKSSPDRVRPWKKWRHCAFFEAFDIFMFLFDS